MPQIKKAEMDLRGSEKGVAIAYSALSPRLSIQGSLGTGFSGLAKDVVNTNLTGFDTTFTVGGDFILRPRLNFETETTPFQKQIDNNFNRSVGFQLTVPIFNNLQTSSSINRAKIQRENARLNVELQQQQLQRNVNQAWTDAQGALQRYRSSEQAVKAAEEAFKYAEDRFNNGVINAVDYGTAKNRLTQAKANLLQARFDYLLKLKVLDFYQGKPLTF
jgi:outer membrane protein